MATSSCRGYWGDDELTRTVLRTDIVPGETLYKTGDLVCRDDNGHYVYLGRTDDVVKRNGVRISLAEVTRVLRTIEAVSGALCLAVDQDDKLRIAAFVEAGPEITAPALLHAAGRHLPPTMLPDEVIVVPSFPMTSSGKIDQDRLRAVRSRSGHTPPQGLDARR